MSFCRLLLGLLFLSLLWTRTALWLDAASGNFGFAFIAGGVLATAVTAGLYHLISASFEERK